MAGAIGFVGGERGALLLLELAALFLLAGGLAVAARRLPGPWRERLPVAVFAALLLVQGVWLWQLSVQPLQLDVDTERHAAALRQAAGLDEVIRLRGIWAADYILQGPGIHALGRLLGLDPLAVYRLLAFAGAAATALLLRAGSRRLGAGPWAASLAGLFPILSFGGAWLTLTLDDNSFASALQWAFFFALLWGLEAGGAGRRDLRGAARMLGVGLLLGLAVSVHRKAWLAGALVPLAPLVAARFRSPAALRGLALVAAAAGLSHLLWASLFLPGGAGRETLALLLSSAHHGHPSWWYPAGDSGLAAQAAAVWHGLHAALVTFPVLREQQLGPQVFHYFDVFVLAWIAGLGAALWRTRQSPGCRLLAAGLAVQVVHSVLYEPLNVERWDMVVGASGVLGAVAATGAERRWQWAAAGLWLLLCASQVLTLRWHPAC